MPTCLPTPRVHRAWQLPVVYASSDVTNFRFPTQPYCDFDPKGRWLRTAAFGFSLDFSTGYAFNCVAASGTCVIVAKQEPLPEVASLEKIHHADRVLELRAPISVKLCFENGLWLAESRAFCILAYGKDKADALRSFAEDLSVMWDAIAQLPDDQLTVDAIALKHNLISIVKSVNTNA